MAHDNTPSVAALDSHGEGGSHHHPHERPLGGKIFTGPVLFLLSLFGICACVLAYRYLYGIGPVSNLTNLQSWGVWKVVGVLVAAAFVNGGFVTALIVYIMNRGEYHRFVRLALLFSFLGYTFAGASLAYDTGRYIGLINFFVPWYMNTNSVLFEVGVCITAYIVVMFIEILPAFLERFMPEGEATDNLAARLHRILNRLLFLTVAFGVLLPTMHQSGLGGIALLFGQKVSLLWQTPWISFLYVVSSIFMGFNIVVIVDMLYHMDELKENDRELVGLYHNLLQMGVYVAIFWIAFRFEEIFRQGGAALMMEAGTHAGFFWLEMAMIVIGIIQVRRAAPRSLFTGSCLMLAGGLLYRINTYIIGFEPAPGVTYFPSLPEFTISVGMLALQIAVFMILVKLFPIVSKS